MRAECGWITDKHWWGGQGAGGEKPLSPSATFSGTAQLRSESLCIPFGLPQKHLLEDAFQTLKSSHELLHVTFQPIWAITDGFTFLHCAGTMSPARHRVESLLGHILWQFVNHHTAQNKLTALMNSKWSSSYLSLDPFCGSSNQAGLVEERTAETTHTYTDLFLYSWLWAFGGALTFQEPNVNHKSL